MDINLLSTNAKCFVDANIFIYHLNRNSNDCASFLSRVENADITAYINTVVIAEILHRQMMLEAVSKGLITGGKAVNKLKANPQIITQLTDYITDLEDLLQLPLQVLEINQPDIFASHILRQNHGLFVNDSINLACAQRLGITDIISHDSDFQRVPKINLWSPSDI